MTEKTIFSLNKKIRKIRVLTQAGFNSLKHNGFRQTAKMAEQVLGLGSVTFRKWAKVPVYPEYILERQRRQTFPRRIMISIITPLYNTPESFLRDMIESVTAQTYSEWELCMADGSDREHEYVQQVCLSYAKMDPRIRYRKLDRNLGIAGNSNACIEMSRGDFIAILDHDDMLHPAALHDVVEVICKEDADFIYTDETTFESPDPKAVIHIHFKPDYSPDNLKSNNYICHLTTFSRVLLDRCGGFREGFDGSQDHELFLRLTDSASRIVHLPRELYFWRAHDSSVALADANKNYAAESGRKAVFDFLRKKGIPASVSYAIDDRSIYRLSYKLIDQDPLVSIIIPNFEHEDDLRRCLTSIKEKTTYQNYEIIIVENNSKDPGIFRYYSEITCDNKNTRVMYWPGTGFNWSALNNFGARNGAKGEYFLLLNNDTEVISPDWIQEMLMYAQRTDVGIVGAMLYYPDDTIQHAGVIIDRDYIATHIYSAVPREDYGYMGRLCYAQNMSAVTGACMLIRKEVFEEVGGLDELFAVGMNDIDLCMRVRKAGYLIVWTPFAQLYHYEYRSRGVPNTSEKKMQYDKERQLFLSRWQKELERGDPYYSPNFSMCTGYPRLNKEEFKRRKSASEKDE